MCLPNPKGDDVLTEMLRRDPSTPASMFEPEHEASPLILASDKSLAVTAAPGEHTRCHVCEYFDVFSEADCRDTAIQEPGKVLVSKEQISSPTPACKSIRSLTCDMPHERD